MSEAFSVAIWKHRATRSLLIMSLRGSSLLAKFALTLFIARFLSFESLGVYGLFAGAAVMIPIVLGLGLTKSISRSAVRGPIEELTPALRQYWSMQAAIYGAALVLALLAAALFGHVFLLTAAVAIIWLEHRSADFFVILNHLRQSHLANILIFVSTTAWVPFFIGLAFLFPSLRNLETLACCWIVGGTSAVLCFAYATHGWPWRVGVTAGRERSLWQQLQDSWVLYVNDIANAAGQYLDRYLVGFLLGLEAAGIYVLFWSIGNALSNLFSTAVILTSEPDLIGAYKQQAPTYWPLFDKLLLETVLGSIALAVAVGLFVSFALPYTGFNLVHGSLPVFWLILCGFVLRMAYEVQGTSFFSRQKDRLTLTSGLLVLAVSALGNLALVPVYSLYAPAIVFIASYLAGAVARYRLLRRERQ